MTRREALSAIGGGAGLVLASSPLQMLMSSLVAGISKKAEASTGSVTPRNYLMFHTQGGPPRTMFDQLLNPYSSDSAVLANLSNGTCFAAPTNGSTVAGQMIYQTKPITVNGQTLNMPPLWSATIPTWAGGDSGKVTGSVPMSNLLNNYLNLRGVDNFTASHFQGAAEKLRPEVSQPSINGLVADLSTRPVPAVGVGQGGGSDFNAFSSATGVGQAYVDGPGGNPTSTLLSVFNNSQDVLPQTYLTRKQAYQSFINSSLSLLGAQAQSRSPGAGSLYSVRNSAVQLLNQGITAYVNQFPAKLAKYQALIGSCADYVNFPIPGITDLPVMATNYTPAQRALGTVSSGQYLVNPDLRTMLSGYGVPTIPNLAESFAIAEILLTNGLSSTLVSQISGAQNLYYNQSAGGVQPAYAGWGFDEHNSGTVISLIINSWVYRSQMACLYELSQQLQSKSMWEETVVEFVGDFPRNANLATFTDPSADPTEIDPSGTGHAPMASIFSIFSGAIQSPLSLGNVYNDSGSGGIPGSWGLTAPVTIAGASVNILNGNVASTLSSLLRINSPTSNNSSLIEVGSNGGISATIEKSRNL